MYMNSAVSKAGEFVLCNQKRTVQDQSIVLAGDSLHLQLKQNNK